MLSKPHRWTASRRPIEESAQSVVTSTGCKFIVDDRVDDKSGHLIIERGYSEYNGIMTGPSSGAQHREMGGGERVNPVLMDRDGTRKFRRNEHRFAK